jgi:hypothetical protein
MIVDPSGDSRFNIFEINHHTAIIELFSPDFDYSPSVMPM